MKHLMRALSLVLVLMLVLSIPALAEGGKKVGLIQYATHPSLDNCTKGFLLGLEEGGYGADKVTVEIQNAMGDMSNSDLQAKTMVSQGVDMVVGVATPSAMSAYAATKQEGIPVVFVAVSDPLAAGIVESLEAPGTNCTGVADVLNLEAQVQMIRAFLPEAKTIGVIYTTSEPNSVSHLEKLNALAPEYGFVVEAVGITNASEVQAAATTLVTKGVDLINNFTDNNVVDNLSVVLHVADEAGIPVFGSEEEQVVNGCLATQGIDYVALGKAAGQMAAQILDGTAVPESLAVEQVSEVTPFYNSEVAARLNIQLPESLEGEIADVAAQAQ